MEGVVMEPTLVGDIMVVMEPTLVGDIISVVIPAVASAGIIQTLGTATLLIIVITSVVVEAEAGLELVAFLNNL
jgi:hypothetical protein